MVCKLEDVPARLGFAEKASDNFGLLLTSLLREGLETVLCSMPSLELLSLATILRLYMFL